MKVSKALFLLFLLFSISTHGQQKEVYIFTDAGRLSRPIYYIENDKINLYKGLQEFQDHLGGQLTITLLEALGKGVEVHEINFDIVKRSVDYLANLA
jgi:hypothetical protein